jgi:hypothetical protein
MTFVDIGLNELLIDTKNTLESGDAPPLRAYAAFIPTRASTSHGRRRRKNMTQSLEQPSILTDDMNIVSKVNFPEPQFSPIKRNTAPTTASAPTDDKAAAPRSRKGKAPLQVAGYEKLVMTDFWNDARRVLAHEQEWAALRDSPQFHAMLEKQRGSGGKQRTFMFDLCDKHVVNPAKPLSDLLVEVVATALWEMQRVVELENMESREKLSTSAGIHRSMDKSMSEEEFRRQKAVKAALKSTELRGKILSMKEAKIEKMEEKRTLALSKSLNETPLERKRREMVVVAEARKQDIMAHQLKQRERMQSRLDGLKERFDTKNAHHAEAEERRAARVEQERREKLAESERNVARIQGGAEEEDKRFREMSRRMLEEKEERFNRSYGDVLEARRKFTTDGQERYQLLSFRAEQRRRLEKEQRDKKLDMVAIRHEKLEASKRLKDALVSQRRQILHKVMTDHAPATAHAPLDITPGPGDYNIGGRGAIRGGRISTSGAEASNLAPAAPLPGPGDYSPKLPDMPNGAIPFSGRGKTYVDDLVLREKKLPGPGQYNLPSKKMSGGVISTAKVPTQIELAVHSRMGLPGPGYYDLDKPPPSPVRPLLKSFGEDVVVRRYPEVAQ